MNKSLLIKWVVRYKNEPSSLWATVISAIHGGVRCQSYIPLKNSIGGVWKSIINTGRVSGNQSINVQQRLTPIIGKGDKTLFWMDIWAGSETLRHRFPSLYALESDKGCKVVDCYKLNQGKAEWFWGSNHSLPNDERLAEWVECTTSINQVIIQLKPDVWLWKSGSEIADFKVNNLRSELDHIDTLNETKALKWLHWIPKNVNCFLWRVVLDRIATREALHLRHIRLPSTSCVFCSNETETVNHLLVTCDTAQEVLTVIFQWMKLPLPRYTLSIVQLLEFIHSHKCQKNVKRWIYAVVAATCWCIWLMRNDFIFKQKQPSMQKLVTDIKAISYTWIKNRAGLSDLDWNKCKCVDLSVIASFNDEKDKIPESLLSRTFADLPAPETKWEEMAPAPEPRLDGASIQINELFYVFSGYRNLDHVHSHVNVYNFTTNKWEESFATPK
ncbi:putative kelch-type beta propeller, reverse transcriptase zinc-binding domain-containing protein [Helianthus annuus]|nr:putative kelch-type beta propeller, reverse transcriptase zinc-binding domain-containing protein [Helianthus annuus]